MEPEASLRPDTKAQAYTLLKLWRSFLYVQPKGRITKRMSRRGSDFGFAISRDSTAECISADPPGSNALSHRHHGVFTWTVSLRAVVPRAECQR